MHNQLLYRIYPEPRNKNMVPTKTIIIPVLSNAILKSMWTASIKSLKATKPNRPYTIELTYPLDAESIDDYGKYCECYFYQDPFTKSGDEYTSFLSNMTDEQLFDWFCDHIAQYKQCEQPIANACL